MQLAPTQSVRIERDGPIEVHGPAVTGLAQIFGRVPPTLLMMLSILSVQLGSALATSLFSSLGPAGTALSSAGFSALVLSVAARPRIDRRIGRHAVLILLFGLVLVGMLLPFFMALQYIPLGIAGMISFLGPLGLAVATSHRLVHFLWIAVAGVGLALLTPDIGADLDPYGLLLAAISAVAWAGFVLVSKRAGRLFDDATSLTLGMWVAAVMLLPIAILEGTIFQAGAVDLAGAFAVALMTTVLPMAMEFQALQRMSARTYGILLTLEPAMGALVGAICLGQAMGIRMSVAIGCVMLAALGVTLSDRREQQ